MRKLFFTIPLLVLIFISGCVQQPQQQEEGAVKKEFYKGAGIFFIGAAPLGDEYKPVLSDLDRAAEDGVDSLVFGPMFYANKEGEVSLFPGTREFLIPFIDEAHARGFKIWINPSLTYDVKGIKNFTEEMKLYAHPIPEMIFHRDIPEEVVENTDVMQNFELAVIEWAKIAEEHKVEIFSPAGEVISMFGIKGMKKWYAEIKPKIEAVYSGKICINGEEPYPIANFPEFLLYSCIAPAIEIPRNEEQEIEVANTINRWYEETKKRNIELIIGDIWEGHNWNGTAEDANRGFAKVFEAGKGKVSGFFVTDFPHFLPPYEHLAPVHFEDFESAVREFYTQNWE